jgi:hypothetical protein
MNQGSLFSWLASCVLLTVNVLADTHQTATKPSSDPPANLARTDYPDWPYPKGVHESPKPDDGQLFRIPGSAKSYTDTQINRSTSTVDWFPELHPAPPAAVISGKQGAYTACGQCHLIDGRGKPDTADLQATPTQSLQLSTFTPCRRLEVRASLRPILYLSHIPARITYSWWIPAELLNQSSSVSSRCLRT